MHTHTRSTCSASPLVTRRVLNESVFVDPLVIFRYRCIESGKRGMKKSESESERESKRNNKPAESGQCIDSISKILLKRTKRVHSGQNMKRMKRAFVYHHFIFLFNFDCFWAVFIIRRSSTSHSTQCRLSSVISTNGPFLINECVRERENADRMLECMTDIKC